jgi:cobalt-zinc-cadmium efflux system membrane fusion protein
MLAPASSGRERVPMTIEGCRPSAGESVPQQASEATPMPARIRGLLAMLLHQVPTVLTLAVLAGVAWLGVIWHWKIPSLPVLLGRAQPVGGEVDKEDEKQEEPAGDHAPLPPVTIPSEDRLREAGVKFATVELRPVAEYVTAHGEVDFNQDHYAHLATRASGTAWSVHKHAGDDVEKGDVLALISSPELVRLKFDLQQDLLLVDTRQRLYNRLKSAGTSTTPQALDAAEASLREARIRLSNDQQALRNMGLTIQAEELVNLNDEQIADRLRTLGIPESLLQRLDAARLPSSLLPMYAPFDGMVVKRDIVIGEMVSPSTPQFVLADLHRLWIRLHVRLEDIRKLRAGQPVYFHQDGPNEDAPPAQIVWISAEVDDKTRSVFVRADVPNPEGRLRPNTLGEARIKVGEGKRLTVPNQALQFDGKSYLVFVRGESPTVFQPVRVRLGPRHEEFTVIDSGLQAGQEIAAAGSHVVLSEMLKKRIGGED